jgi:hypothetical protein
VFGFTCSDYTHVLSTNRTWGYGCGQAPGIPCALAFIEGGKRKARARPCRENAVSCLLIDEWEGAVGCAFDLDIFVNQKEIFGPSSNCLTDFYPTLDRSP